MRVRDAKQVATAESHWSKLRGSKRTGVRRTPYWLQLQGCRHRVVAVAMATNDQTVEVRWADEGLARDV